MGELRDQFTGPTASAPRGELVRAVDHQATRRLANRQSLRGRPQIPEKQGERFLRVAGYLAPRVHLQLSFRHERDQRGNTNQAQLVHGEATLGSVE